jgi:hypothetical protein
MGNQHQKNLKVILSMEQNKLAHWLANLPDDQIEYVEWLVEEVDIALENMIIEQSGLEAARDVIKKYTLNKKVD